MVEGLQPLNVLRDTNSTAYSHVYKSVYNRTTSLQRLQMLRDLTEACTLP